MRIKRYYVVAAPDVEKLQNEVAKLVIDGWQPYGQLVVGPPAAGSDARFFQAMVQYEGEIRAG